MPHDDKEPKKPHPKPENGHNPDYNTADSGNNGNPPPPPGHNPNEPDG